MISISSLIGIYLFELGVSFYNPQKQLINWDRRSLLEVYEDERSSKSGASVPIFPYLFINDDKNHVLNSFGGVYPVGGLEDTATYMCNEWGEYNQFTSDKFGLNNDNSIYDKPKINLLIGDSFAFGACLDAPDTLAGNLDNLLDGDILNLSYSGNGPLLSLKTVADILPKSVGEIQSVVYVYFAGNDFENLDNELQNQHLSAYLQCVNLKDCNPHDIEVLNLYEEKKVFLDSLLLESKKINIEEMVNSIKGFVLLRNTRKFLIPISFRDHILTTFDWNYDAFEKTLLLFSNLAKGSNAPGIFVYLPDNKGSARNHNYDYNKSKVLEIVQKSELKIIDFEKYAIEKGLSTSPSHLGGFGHHTPEANLILADLISKAIESYGQ
jgi:hypothetical protein